MIDLSLVAICDMLFLYMKVLTNIIGKKQKGKKEMKGFKLHPNIQLMLNWLIQYSFFIHRPFLFGSLFCPSTQESAFAMNCKCGNDGIRYLGIWFKNHAMFTLLKYEKNICLHATTN